MTARVDVKPQILRWAVKRAQFDEVSLESKFPELKQWLTEDVKPTFKQLELFAQATHVAIGYLFLPSPPDEILPIPDFRTLEDRGNKPPSPELLDTIHSMQRRQAWLRDDYLEVGAKPLKFVGSAKITDKPAIIGREMRKLVGITDGWAATINTWELAVGELRKLIEKIQVIAVINGIVGNSTNRKLDVSEFRGFAICDPYAPLIFVNGADSKSAQMFTLAHELAHLWLGQSALTDSGILNAPTSKVEQWCDTAAAEFLVSEQEMRDTWQGIRNEPNKFDIIARQFKVSPIVAGRRAKDIGLIKADEFFRFYKSYTQQELQNKKNKSSGGDFYQNQKNRIGENFARHVMLAALSGRLSFKEAYSLTGLKGGTFQKYAHQLGVKFP
jgi:Zn-dependent peptidase ImmA (M78 family)